MALRSSVKPISAISAIAIVITAIVITAGLYLIALVIIGGITAFLINREKNLEELGKRNSFKRLSPFSSYGVAFGDFEHTFIYEKPITNDLVNGISNMLRTNFGSNGLQDISITDIDPNLESPDSRQFFISNIATTDRKTPITLIVNSKNVKNVQSVRWWIMLGGHYDKESQMFFIIFSPLTFWFWIFPYIRGNYNLLERIKSVYSSSYNDFDIATLGRSIHKEIFNTLVHVMDHHNIDTSDLKLQKMQAMNINISGGKVEMGNIVQGSANSFASGVVGKKS